ncbi:two-partner secretion domain-containing protein [Acinetobacter vivianii]|uniref:two-partner secretion domain-containing protein n=1 Tax=Acinetobacter vivianii TaxID=1776742 RepID=UPI002DB88F61|nr:hemagglutinin repeat-containing protein [Acinetobacter vivianii]MEB6478665.1 hemagglutinin repeat-containing protein [Acinetobacter vivianii]MEB6657504.1 hemagglutinin repeat-containing protein [Acinetobacter vivianii]
MNKNRYRVIFSQARGMFIAVAEIVKSRTKTAGQSIAGTDATEIAFTPTSYKKLNPLNFAVVCVLGAVVYTVPLSSIANTQIIADKSAPRNQQPQILNSANGTVQVNIQTPSAGGVSRNTFKQFDVGQEGAILNNARNNTQTQIGGWVQGNSNLARGEAKVILNEVNSSNPSQLRGYLEVAGKSAQVVIANPAGLICDGCGVINADRFTLTTGQAVMNQGYLESFRVREGQVTIEGKGLNGSLTPFTDIYTQALKVNAGLYAKELNVVLGQNDIQVKDQTAPQYTSNSNAASSNPSGYALDVGKLGGMYAGKIFLVGTEQGLGVRNAGSISSTESTLTLNANGDLINQGNIIAAKDQIELKAQNIENTGNISSTNNKVQLQASNIKNAGLIASLDEIRLDAKGSINNNQGVINAGRLDLTAKNLSNEKGQIEQVGGSKLNITAQSLDNLQGRIGRAVQDSTNGNNGSDNTSVPPAVKDPGKNSSAQDASKVEVIASTDVQPKTFADGVIQVENHLNNQSGKISNNNDTTLTVQDKINNTGGELQLPELKFTGQEFENQGGKLSANQIDIQANKVNNQKGQLNASQALEIRSQQLNNQAGSIQSEQALKIQSQQMNNQEGKLVAVKNIDVQTGLLNNQKGVIASTKQNVVIKSGNLDNSAGQISGQQLDISTQQINNQRGSIQSQSKDLNLSATQIDNGLSKETAGNIIAAKNLNLQAQQLQTSGQIYAGDSAQLKVSQLQQHGQLAAQNQVKVQAEQIQSNADSVWAAGLSPDGKLNNDAATLEITAQDAQIAGKLLAGAQVSVKASNTADLSDSATQAKNIQIETTELKTNRVKLIAEQQLNLKASQSIENEAGQYSAADVQINTKKLNNNKGLIQHTGKDDFVLNIADRIDNDAGKLISNAANTEITTKSLRSVEGAILHAGDQQLKIAAQDLQGQQGKIQSNGNLQFELGTTNLDGATTSAKNIKLSADSLSHQKGQMLQSAADGTLQVEVTKELNNQEGEISAAGNSSIKAQSLNNQSGKVLSNGQLDISVTDLNNKSGTIYAKEQLHLNTSGQVNNQAGLMVAKQAEVKAQSLNNSAGRIRAEQGGLNLIIEQQLQNQAGEIYATDNIGIKAQQLSNQKGLIQSKNNIALNTGSLDNQSGTIYAEADMAVQTQTELNNQQGILAAKKQLDIRSGALNNQSGIIRAEQGNTQIQAQGIVQNNQGEISAANNLNVMAQGLDNQAGQLFAQEQLLLDTQQQNLDNVDGRILSKHVDLNTGTLNNKTGLIQAESTLKIDTQNHDLINQDSGDKGGILSQGALQLNNIQQLHNQRGLIASVGKTTMQAQHLENQSGQINSQTDLVIQQKNTGAVLNNQGQIQALKNVQINVDQVNNNGSASHIVAGENLAIQAQRIDNRDNHSKDVIGGLDAKNIQLNAKELNNQAGAIRASEDANLSIQTQLNNQQGSISSLGKLNIGQTEQSLTIDNTAGELLAQKQLNIQANELINQGKIISLGDAEISLKQNYTQNKDSELKANGTLKLRTEKDIINQSEISAGKQLHLNAQNILNQKDATINSAETHLIAQNKVHNKGLINGGLTHIQAQHVHNDGARIYGDHVAIQAQTLDNKSNLEGVGAVIASRGDMHLGIGTLNNQAGGAVNSVSKDNAWILSMGKLKIGGSLDENYQAQGKADLINNRSATIESQGDMQLDAKRIDNINENFEVKDAAILESSVKVHGYEDNRHPGIDVSEDIVEFQKQGNFLWMLLKDGRRLRTYNIFEYDKETYVPEVISSTPGQIISGGNMLINAEHVLNDQSQILAAKTLTVQGTSIENKAYTANKTTKFKNPIRWFYDSGRKTQIGFNPADETEPFVLSGLYGGDQVIGTPTHQIKAVESTQAETDIQASQQAGKVELQPQQTEQKQIDAQSGQPVDQENQSGSNDVDAAKQLDASQENLDQTDSSIDHEVRTVQQKSIRLPSNALFIQTKDSQAGFLVETDPAFSNYKKWLSSDHMLNALGLDPAKQQKRLGDGYYEQRLVQDQIAQLTGRRFLSGYGSDEEQYIALMNNGLTFAKQFNLTPGIALTPAQIAQLTSDIVWLEEKTITLPDGTTTKALVPQVYVKSQVGDLKGDGTLIAADQVQLDMQGDVLNSATIAGREALKINANSINQLNGRLEANRIGISTQQDLNNIGSQIVAKDALSMEIGGNFNHSSTLSSNSNKSGQNEFGFTKIDRKAGIYVGNGQNSDALKNTLNIRVGGNTSLKAADIINSNGSSVIQTQGDVSLDTLQTERVTNSYTNKKNFDFGTQKQDVGNQIQSKGDLTLTGKNIDITGSQLSSEQGKTLVSASEDLTIKEGRKSSNYEHADESKKKGFLSKKTTQNYIKDAANEAIASTVDGKQVILDAKNIKIQGSEVVSDELTQIQAKENIEIKGADSNYLNIHNTQTKKSGLMSGGGFGISIGSKKEKTEQEQTQHTNSGSMVGSLNGNTNIVAGKNYQQTGSTVSSQQGDVNILAQQVTIEAAKEQSTSQYKHEMEQKGLTVAVNVPVVSAVQTSLESGKQVGQSKNDRVNAMAAANAGFDAYKAGQTLAQLKDAATSAANLAQSANVSVSITYGEQKNTEFNRSESNTANQSTVSAGGKTNIVATGAGQDSNINIIGSDVMGLKGTHLAADQNVNIKAAEQNSKEESGNKSAGWNAGVAVSYGSNGLALGVTAGGNLGKGNGNGTETSYVNSHVGSKDSLTSISSGNATNIIGGQVQGKAVQVDAKALNIESLQDKASYKSKQQNVEGQVTVGYGASASGSFSKSNINANHASVSEQSGVFAGDEGYQIKVKDNTDLKGAIITSTQLAETQNKNNLSTGTLTHSELRNVSEYDAKGISIGAGFNAGKNDAQGQKQPDTVLSKSNKIDGHASSQVGVSKSLGFGLDSDKDSSVTKSGVNTKNITIANEAGQQQLTGKTAEQLKSEILTDVTTDTARENSGALNNVFDKDKVQKEINLQMDVTKKFDANRQEAKAEINKQIDELKAAGKDASQWQKAGVLLDMVSAGLSAPTASGAGIAASTLSPAASYEIGQYFKGKDAEGSAAHILAHTILGAAVAATGGNNALSAGIAAGSAEAAAPLLAEYLYGKKAIDLTASEKSTISSIVGLAGSAVGATTGDVSSTVQGGQSAQNAVENNKTSYTQDVKHAVLCWSAKCQQDYKDMDARQEAAYRKGQDQALSKFVEDIKNLPNVPKELYDALKNDPQGTAKAILLGLKEIPGNIWDTSMTITKENIAGNSPADFERLGKAETSAVLNTLSGLLSGGAVAVAKKGGKIVLGLKADFDPNLNVQVNGVSGGKSKTNSIDEEKKALEKIKNNPKGENLSSKPNDTVINQQASKRVNQVTAPIDFDGHILSAEVKPNGSVVGGHSTATGNVKVLQVIGKPDKNGVYQARVAVSDKSGQYVNKTNNGGISTMFPDSWSADRLKVEVDAAYKNRQPVPNKPNMWQGKTPSGVDVTGYLQPKTTVYPKPPMQ